MPLVTPSRRRLLQLAGATAIAPGLIGMKRTDVIGRVLADFGLRFIYVVLLLSSLVTLTPGTNPFRGWNDQGDYRCEPTDSTTCTIACSLRSPVTMTRTVISPRAASRSRTPGAPSRVRETGP